MQFCQFVELVLIQESILIWSVCSFFTISFIRVFHRLKRNIFMADSIIFRFNRPPTSLLTKTNSHLHNTMCQFISWHTSELFPYTILLKESSYPVYSARGICKKNMALQNMVYSGATMGMLLGIFFFPPFEMLIEALVGALIGELLSGSMAKEALRADWGVVVGNMPSTVLKLTYTCTCLVFISKSWYRCS